MNAVKSIINETLYQQFGHQRVDDDRATAAYKGLLRQLNDPELIVATTNYDRAVETALSTLGRVVDAGFRRSPYRTPTLEPTGLVENSKGTTPVIHLHGAVGWYEKDGSVKEHPADSDFNPTLGTPVVLYPDPEKDPTNDALVSQLWTEFRTALQLADRILLVGHSLHDPALVEALRQEAPEKPLVVTYIDEEGKDAIDNQLPDALAVQMDFGPTIKTKWPFKKLMEDPFRG